MLREVHPRESYHYKSFNKAVASHWKCLYISELFKDHSNFSWENDLNLMYHELESVSGGCGS